jgi:hypothetical protein
MILPRGNLNLSLFVALIEIWTGALMNVSLINGERAPPTPRVMRLPSWVSLRGEL